jgi:hypothetical protein
MMSDSEMTRLTCLLLYIQFPDINYGQSGKMFH